MLIDLVPKKHNPKLKNIYEIIIEVELNNENFATYNYFFESKYDAMKYINMLTRLEELDKKYHQDHPDMGCMTWDYCSEDIEEINHSYPEVYKALHDLPLDYDNVMFLPELYRIFYYDKNGEKWSVEEKYGS